MFNREHHRRIARVLSALNASVLLDHHCLFGGGTAMALRYGEYRESVDIDFLISDQAGYRGLRQLLSGSEGMHAITAGGAGTFKQIGAIRMDQYGIRTRIEVDGHPIKFEIVHEARITLAEPNENDEICGVSTLTTLDMASGKLLANADRWNDESVFNRDLIDLAMMCAPLPLLREAVRKTEPAYGDSIRESLGMAIEKIRTKPDWLDRCIQVMAMDVPKSLLWQRIRNVGRVLK